MKIHFWSIGKPHENSLKYAIEDFTKRINKYYPVGWKIIPPSKISGNLNEEYLKKKEAEKILNQLSDDNYIVILDEKGKELNSEGLANFLQARANESVKNLMFIIGGAYGMHQSILKKSKFKWSLSQLTLPHQLVRLLLAEQVYRACTILRNEKYHHK